MLFWGKGNRKSGLWHPLVYHMLDVAAVAREVLYREPEITRRLYAEDLGLPWEKALPWILLFVAFHDIGKATPAFQHMARRIIPEHQEFLKQSGFRINDDLDYVHHTHLTEELLHDLFHKELNLDSILVLEISKALSAHHGYQSNSLKNDKYIGAGHQYSNWEEARLALLKDLISILDVDSSLPPDGKGLSGGAFMRLSGLTSFSDWIGSDEHHFPYHPIHENIFNLQSYFEDSPERARNALESVGWFNRKPLIEEKKSFAEIFPFSPRPLQKAMEEITAKAESPMLILVEAPMGEGKTEAAFMAHLNLQRLLGHRGLYVALPTQATGNAMFERTYHFLKKLKFGGTLDLQLLHGASLLNDRYMSLKPGSIHDEDESQENQERDEQPERDGSVQSGEWFTHKKRALLSEYGVGTVDQALLSILNVKHHFVRMWGLANRTVVLDEVHAYDVYTGGLIECLVEWLHELHSSVILMSATLPREKRERLLKAYGATEIEPVEYPGITFVEKGNRLAKAISFKDESVNKNENHRKKTVTVQRAPVDEKTLVGELIRQVRDGGCLVCIVNTVDRAQKIYRILKENSNDIELSLFHARYPAEERKRREDEVLMRFGNGKDTIRPRKAILVATQVVEQSLDLDFDVMFSDLAPIDLLLQRLGRLHRHFRTERYHHSEPVIYISGHTENGELPEMGEPYYWDSIYERYYLLKTWQLLQNISKIEIPADISPFVEQIYSPAPIYAGPHQDVFEQAMREMKDSHDTDENRAIQAMLGSPSGGGWNDLNKPKLREEEDGLNLHPLYQGKTRLGDPTVIVIPLHKMNEDLYLDNEGKHRIDLNIEPDLKIAKNLFMKSIQPGNRTIVDEYKNLEQPAGWKKNPLLRNCKPIILIDGMISFDSLTMILDPELGVIYEKNKK